MLPNVLDFVVISMLLFSFSIFSWQDFKCYLQEIIYNIQHKKDFIHCIDYFCITITKILDRYNLSKKTFFWHNCGLF